MELNKYKLHGPYHWDWYGKRSTYTRHADFLRRWVNEKDTLEIGAGDGFITNFLGIHGVDNDPYAVKLAAKKGAKIDLGDPYELPYKDGEFDSALMSDSINYFRSAVKPIREARRVIKKYLYVSIPSLNKPLELGHLYHSWPPQELKTFVEKNGFVLIDGPRLKYDKSRYYFKFQKI